MKKVLSLILALTLLTSLLLIFSSCEEEDEVCSTCYDHKEIVCKKCYGEGKILLECDKCHGEGSYWVENVFTGKRTYEFCSECNGSHGKYLSSNCSYCDGTGKQVCPDCSSN